MQSPTFVFDGESRNHQSLGSLTAPTAFAVANLYSGRTPARSVLLTVEVAAIRFTENGTTPTTTATTGAGHRMDAGQSHVIRGFEAVRNFLCINEVAGNGAIVKATFRY